MAEIHIDFETRSAVDLRKTGVHRYAEDITTDIWCMAWCFDGEGPGLWRPGEDPPPEVVAHIATGGPLVAHNANFELTLWDQVLTRRYGFPPAPIEQWRCTMAAAYAMALPGALGDAAGALGLDEAKDVAGHRLMLSMAKPRKVVGKLPATSFNSTGAKEKVSDEGWQEFIGADGLPLKILWWVDPDRLHRLYAYCAQDVRTEMALDKRLLRLRPEEQRLWHLDQRINARGVHVDETACLSAIEIVEKAREEANREMKVASNYEVASTTAVAQIIAFLEARGVKLEGLAKDQVTEMLARDDLAPECRRVLELRQQGARMATTKIQALLNGRSRDGRAKGLLQYHAASTGRWGGRRFQPQNLKRPDADQATIDFLIDTLRRPMKPAERYAVFSALVDDPIEALGDCVRGLVVAPPGRAMGAADFANIEGRVLAWLAGENWKIEAFKAYDAGTGPDLYKVAYSSSFGVPVEGVSKDKRQIGKVQELALGYQGGPGAFQAMARGYGIDIGARCDEILDVADPALADEAWDAWETYGRKSGMAESNWIAAEVIKRAWRGSHSATVALWADIEEAAIRAVQQPGTVFTLGRLRFRVSGSFLFMQLPSGRCLCYPYPKVEAKRTPWGSTKDLVTFFGQDTLTRKWGRTSTYGGKLTENAVQAIARDLLAEALVRLEDAGVDTVLHVHDEAVFHADPGVEDCEHVCSLMSQVPGWAEGLPVATEGWIGERYRK